MIFPIESSLEEIKKALSANKNLILTAEPGAGKSTVVPLALMNEAWLEGKKIIMLQPRRVAAVAVASRMAEIDGSEPGKNIGHSVRFSSNIKASTKIEVLTEGILTKRIQNDPFLENVGLVIFDEFHERSIHADLGLALCCEIKKEVRPDLRLMVMSATIATELIRGYLDNSEIINGKGFLYPVTVEYMPVWTGRAYFDNAAKAIYEIVTSCDEKEEYLVFLPGIGEINRVRDFLESTSVQQSHDILTLHGSMSIKEQQRVLGNCNVSSFVNGCDSSEKNKPKIILSTNIAETSLTIEGITTVIDTGYMRQNQFNSETGLNKLEIARISKASAKQRAGRAGRLKPGKAIRLYSKAEFENFAEDDVPEILRSDLASSILELYYWGIKDPYTFNWLECPKKESIKNSIELLKMLGIIDEKGLITDFGKKVNNIPTEPRLAVMLIKAKEAGCLEEAALATAIIEEKDFLFADRSNETSEKLWQSRKKETDKTQNAIRINGVDPDLYIRLSAFEDKSNLPKEYSVDNQIMKRILKEQKQLIEKLD